MTTTDAADGEALASIVPAAPLPAEGRRGLLGGYGEFELDVEEVLREKLPGFFERLESMPLTLAAIETLPQRSKGAYLLFRGDDPRPVYAGKTDTTHGFRDRLARHAWTVQGRQGLAPDEMRFKAVRIMVFAALDAEAILIREMRRLQPGSLSWNNSGFGSNDPGKNRDGQEPAQFDKDFPIDIEFEVADFPEGRMPVGRMLDELKQQIPYLLRHKGLPASAEISVPGGAHSVRSLLKSAIDALPPGFQATVLHGRIVVYHENKDYEYMLEAMRS